MLWTLRSKIQLTVDIAQQVRLRTLLTILHGQMELQPGLVLEEKPRRNTGKSNINMIFLWEP